MTQEELKECVAMQRRLAALCREDKLYGIHRWGVHLTERAYEGLFGPGCGIPVRRERTVDGVAVFCLPEERRSYGQL